VCTSGAVNASVARFTFTNPIGKTHSIAIAFAGAGTWKKLCESIFILDKENENYILLPN